MGRPPKAQAERATQQLGVRFTKTERDMIDWLVVNLGARSAGDAIKQAVAALYEERRAMTDAKPSHGDDCDCAFCRVGREGTSAARDAAFALVERELRQCGVRSLYFDRNDPLVTAAAMMPNTLGLSFTYATLREVMDAVIVARSHHMSAKWEEPDG
jgi:hypothetical protein